MRDKMENESIQSSNDIVYYISKISKEWALSNPYNIALRALLGNYSSIEYQPTSSMGHQLFITEFMCKTINNEKITDEFLKDLYKLIDEFHTDKIKKNGELIIETFFIIYIVNLLEHDKIFKKIKINKIKSFLNDYNPVNDQYTNIKKILCKVYGIENNDKSVCNDDYTLALNLLYLRLSLNDEKNRDQNTLLDYYAKQKILSDNIFSQSLNSERIRGRVLEIALIMKASSGKGLFLPEIEKIQYLSSFARKLIINQMNLLYLKGSTFEFNEYKIPYWIVPLPFLILEAIIYMNPQVINSISISFIEVSVDNLLSLSYSFILVLNGIILTIYLYFVNKRIIKTLEANKK